MPSNRNFILSLKPNINPDHDIYILNIYTTISRGNAVLIDYAASTELCCAMQYITTNLDDMLEVLPGDCW